MLAKTLCHKVTLFAVLFCALAGVAVSDNLQVGYYNTICSDAEPIVRRVVSSAFLNFTSLHPLQRLHMLAKTLCHKVTLFAVLFCAFVGAAVSDNLQVGYYNTICSDAEPIVRRVVSSAFLNFTGVAAKLIRLHFHDCFVRVSSLVPPVFGGQTASPAPSFVFGSQPTAPSAGQSVFQFGAQPGPAAANPITSSAPSTFDPVGGGGLEFSGGGFSLGARGDRGNRKFIKEKRDKTTIK